MRNLKDYRDELMEHINDNVLDMLDEFSDEEIADKVIEIAGKLENRNSILSRIGQYQIKVNNGIKGFVSVSDSDTTGVSRTVFRPFYIDDDDEENGYSDGLYNLSEMISEAWFACISN